MLTKAADIFSKMQEDLISALVEIDPTAKVTKDSWKRDDPKVNDGGGGLSIVISGGKIFEKGGVNFSSVHGYLTAEMSKTLLSSEKEVAFSAVGTSIVIHPHSPMVPTVHANVRYFQTESSTWFGGGTDLTPYYLFSEDAKYFHLGLKQICDRHNKEYYPKFKKWCDDYFFLPHRGEARGVGGIFFDYLGKEGGVGEYINFVKDIALNFKELYLPIVKKRATLDFTQAQKRFQLLRRGRYVEFNLLYDRGTAFGLKSGGRTESILMSLPAEVCWEYGFEAKADSEEGKLLDVLRSPIDWA